ncbi:MAG: sensor histidine kinase [Pseudomarimonas sp.]
MTPVLALLWIASIAVAAVGGFMIRRQPRKPVSVSAPVVADDRAELIARTAAEERERIYADLHDDLGARLLELIYSAPDQASGDRARAILQDLRDVVSRSRSDPGTLLDVLASIRSEATQRLNAAGAELNWQAADDLPDPALDQATALHLHRIVREAISNAIRHARARRLRVRVALGTGRELMLELTDEGGIEPAPAEPANAGTGVSNMRARAQALHGDIRWTAGTLGGTKVLLKAPLPPDLSAPELAT